MAFSVLRVFRSRVAFRAKSGGLLQRCLFNSDQISGSYTTIYNANAQTKGPLGSASKPGAIKVTPKYDFQRHLHVLEMDADFTFPELLEC